MIVLRRSVTALALIAALGTSAEAASVNPYSSFWTLGDSLSDNGNLYAASGGTEPASPPYHEGRFSNGPVWAEHVASAFATESHPSGNFAFGGANAIADADPVPDLGAQLGLFAANATPYLGSRPLASLWFGANDLLGTGIPNGTAAATGRQAARSVGAGARALAGLGVRDVMIFNLPDLGSVPRFALSGDPALQREASRGSAAFNRTLDKQIVGLRQSGVNVIKIDIESLFRDLLANPESYGVSNATIPCLIPGQAACTNDEALQRAFFDTIHPNSVIHGAIGDIALSEIAAIPVPMPALLLLSACGGLLLLRRGST